MFDLRFVGPALDDGRSRRGLITVGEHTEGFVAPLTFWDSREYERQWLVAARRLLAGEDRTAFFTSMADPASGQCGRWWPAWREGERVYVQEHLLLLSALDPPFELSDPYRHIRDRQQISEDGHRISEWRVRLADIAAFVARHPDYHPPT